MGKGEIVCKEPFLLFQQGILLVWRTVCHIPSKLKLSSSNSVSLEESKISCFGKGYTILLPFFNNKNYVRHPKLKAIIADKNQNMTRILELGGEKRRKILVCQHFILFPQCFSIPFFSQGHFNFSFLWERVYQTTKF